MDYWVRSGLNTLLGPLVRIVKRLQAVTEHLLKQFSEFFATDINSRAYSKTYHVFRISNFLSHVKEKKIENVEFGKQGKLFRKPDIPLTLNLLVGKPGRNFQTGQVYRETGQAFQETRQSFGKPGRLFGKPGRHFRKPGRLLGKRGRLFGKPGRLFGTPDKLFG